MKSGTREPLKTPSSWAGGPSTYTDGPVSNIRAVIAKRLGESKVILIFY